MKSTAKMNRAILIFFGIIFIFSSVIVNNLNFKGGNDNKINLDNDSLKVLEVSGKIHIINNSGWVAFKSAGNCTGNGTYSDPYVIEGLEIDGGSSGSCIMIENSTSYFKIINCFLYNSRAGDLTPPAAAITLFNVSNGLITQNNCTFNEVGITIWGDNNTISENFITDNHLGTFSFGLNNITENNISGNLGGIGEAGGATILLNNVTDNEDFGIMLVGAQNSSIIRNSINNNNKDGIILVESRYNNISRNECNNNKIHGICLEGWFPNHPNMGYNWISENIVNDNLYGITLNYSEYNQIINNEVNNNEISGIVLANSNYNNIFKNYIEENYYGINMNESLLNHLTQNTINYNYYGISLTFSCQNHISNNILHYNGVCIMDDDYCYNSYENNDCIDIKDKEPDLILPIVITVTILLGLTVIILTYQHYKKKLHLKQ